MSILNTPPQPIMASCSGEKVENGNSLQMDRETETEKDIWIDSQTYARTDRQTDKTYQKKLT